VNRVPAVAPSERPPLRLVKVEANEQAERMATATAKVSALDAHIAQTPPDPQRSPLLTGRLEKRYDLMGRGTRLAYVFYGLGIDDDIIVTFPARADTNTVALAIREAIDTIRGELEPAPEDD